MRGSLHHRKLDGEMGRRSRTRCCKGEDASQFLRRNLVADAHLELPLRSRLCKACASHITNQAAGQNLVRGVRGSVQDLAEGKK